MEMTNSPVHRVRKFVSAVHWPSRRQVTKRGCDPYVEFDLHGKIYRAHFTANSTMKAERPHSVHVTAQGLSIKVSPAAYPNETHLPVGRCFVVRTNPHS